MENKEKSVFEELYKVNVNEHKEDRDGLSYLSWAWAVAEVLNRYPNMTYEVVKNENGQPYFFDENLGYMVMTKVTIEGKTNEMWLPVMDSANRAMRHIQYKVPTKKGEVTVKPATMFDINKTIMRCLVKNIGMFGLGLYIYAGEDLPEIAEEDKPMTEGQIDAIKKLTSDEQKLFKELMNEKGFVSSKELTRSVASDILLAVKQTKKGTKKSTKKEEVKDNGTSESTK